MRNVRAKENSGPPLPIARHQIIFTDEYTKTEKNENFLAYDSGAEADRILIFSTQGNLDLVRRSNHWHGDGTFKTVPPLFEQLYTIHGLEDNKSFDF